MREFWGMMGHRYVASPDGKTARSYCNTAEEAKRYGKPGDGIYLRVGKKWILVEEIPNTQEQRT